MTTTLDVATTLDVPQEMKEKASATLEGLVAKLSSANDRYRAMQGKPTLEIAGPTAAGHYKYWDALLVGPYQFFGNPPYLPNKIIAAGELALMYSLVWVNPVPPSGTPVPPTEILGGRAYHFAFETIDLSSVGNGPESSGTGVFPDANAWGPTPVVAIPWWFIVPDPGPKPMAMYETNFAMDLDPPGSQFAAYASWRWDPDTDPPFLWTPGSNPHFDHDIGARWLAFHK
jgi:hypothetical protein